MVTVQDTCRSWPSFTSDGNSKGRISGFSVEKKCDLQTTLIAGFVARRARMVGLRAVLEDQSKLNVNNESKALIYASEINVPLTLRTAVQVALPTGLYA